MIQQTFSSQLIDEALRKTVWKQNAKKKQLQDALQPSPRQKVQPLTEIPHYMISGKKEKQYNKPLIETSNSPINDTRKNRTRVFGLKHVDRNVFKTVNYCKQDFYIERAEVPALTDIKINQTGRLMVEERRLKSPILKQVGDYEYKVIWE